VASSIGRTQGLPLQVGSLMPSVPPTEAGQQPQRGERDEQGGDGATGVHEREGSPPSGWFLLVALRCARATRE